MRMDRFVTNFKYSGNFMRAQANAERVDEWLTGTIYAATQTIKGRAMLFR